MNISPESSVAWLMVPMVSPTRAVPVCAGINFAKPKSRIFAWPNDALGVRGVERIGNFDGDIEQAVEFQRAAVDQVLQSGAVQKFHGDEGFAVLFADIVDGADVGMIQRGGCLRFAFEAT